MGVIGYRVFHLGGSAPDPPLSSTYRRITGRRQVLSTAIGSDHIVVTIEVAGSIEVLTFDPDTLRPLGRLRLKAP